jgi:peptidoglycan/xylan/chitin deacetylase (PgdA/CDA1 family)
MERHMGPRFLSHLGVRAALALAVACAPWALAERLGELTPPMPISVDGHPATVPPHTNFAQAILSFHLHASPAQLLDVHGAPIETLQPGQILLNGVDAPLSTPLAAGDSILVLDGVDRTEPTKRVVTLLPGRRPGDPQFTLGTSRVLRIETAGRISRESLSVRYRPYGRTIRPPAVALTFDDGPWPDSTTKVLAVLKRLHVKATFFVIGYLAERYPEIVRAELSAGMRIGDHSWDHPTSLPFTRLSPRRAKLEMAKVKWLLNREFGMRPSLFRPPGGTFDRRVVATADRLGMRVVLWNVDPRDWSRSATTRSIVANVLRHVGPGSIVELHDGGGDSSATIRALPRIVRGIRRMGLRLVTISV